MPWSNARTCAPCHVARLAPGLTRATQLLLVVIGIVCCMSMMTTQVMGVPLDHPQPNNPQPPAVPSATRSADDADDTAVEEAVAAASSSSSAEQLGTPGSSSAEFNASGTEVRPARSVATFRSVINLKWILQKEGHYITIHPDGRVNTTKDLKPGYGIMMFKPKPQRLPPIFSTSAVPSPTIITIKGNRTGRYLCMTPHGRVYASEPDIKIVPEDCNFLEMIPEHNYNSYCQEKRTGGVSRPSSRSSIRHGQVGQLEHPECNMHCLGVTTYGKIRNGSRTCFNKDAAKFLVLKVEMPSETSRPDLFQTVTERPRCDRKCRRNRKNKRKRKRKRKKQRNCKPGTDCSIRTTAPTSPPCNGMFCTGQSRRTKPRRKKPRKDRQHRDNRQNRGRHRRLGKRQRDKRPRRAEGTEMGPLSDVTNRRIG